MLLDMVNDLSNSITEKNRDILLNFLNRAYKELYDTYDLPNSIFDEYFEVDGTDGQIVLPEYVDDIRGAGAYMSRVPLTVRDFRSGYRVTPRFQQPYEWRVRAVVPLSSQMDATDLIRVVLQDEETETLNVYITGRTATSSMYTETLTFEPGETEKTTTAQFLADDPYAITMIAKDITTQHDIVFYVNSTGTEISRLRNRLLRAQYRLIQVSDGQLGANPFIPATQPFSGAMIVYKRMFIPLYADTDEIIYPNAQDAVVWKAREIWYGTQLGDDAMKSAKYAYQKCLALINTLVMNQESAAEMKMTPARNPYANAWRATGRGAYGYGWTAH